MGKLVHITTTSDAAKISSLKKVMIDEIQTESFLL